MVFLSLPSKMMMSTNKSAISSVQPPSSDTTPVPPSQPITSKAADRFELYACREKLLSHLLYVSFAVKKDMRASEGETERQKESERHLLPIDTE